MDERPPVKGQEPRPDYLEQAPSALHVVVYDPSGQVLFSVMARLRKMQTGSWGYHTAGKIDLPRVLGERLQINAGLTVINSKNRKQPEVSK